MQAILEYLPTLLKGVCYTLAITAVSMVLGTVIGITLALMQLSSSKILISSARIYNSIFRGLPLLIQILYIYFGLPLLFGARVPALIAGTVAVTLYTGAFMAEIFRSGIVSIDTGQMEAGRSIGFTYWQSMRLVVFPQAFWRMIPASANQLSITLKDTSLLSVIGVSELTMSGQSIYSVNFDTIRVLTLVGVMYFIVFFIAERLSFALERVGR